MKINLRYGVDATLTLELPREAVVADCRAPRGTPLADPAAAVAAAMLDPLDFPPLVDATVPGDRIVLALAEAVPQAAQLVAGVVHTLREAGAEAERIAVAVSGSDAEAQSAPVTHLLDDDLGRRVRQIVHDPADRQQLAYLGATREAKPIYLNRALCDADLVLPIGCVEPDSALGYVGLDGGLCPTFADDDTQRRFRAPSSSLSDVQSGRRREEAAEATRMLGPPATIQVVPGAGDAILHVLAGAATAVAHQAETLCDAAWRFHAEQPAELVVAAIEGGPPLQTWRSVARALAAAGAAVDDGGAIVLCTDLATPPGPALRRLLAADDAEQIQRDMQRDRTPDALAAVQLARTLARANVYLLSQLGQGDVEPLGMAHIDHPSQIATLCRRYDHCTLLSNAQHIAVTVQPCRSSKRA